MSVAPPIRCRALSTTVICGVTFLLGSVTAAMAQPASGRTDLEELVKLSERLLDFASSPESAAELAWLRDLQSFNERHGLGLEVGGVVSGSGVGVGLEHTVWKDANAAFGWTSLRTYKGYQELGLFYERRLHSEDRMFRTELRSRNLPQERFYGLGGDSSRGDRTSFRLTENRFRSELRSKLTDNLALSIHGSFRNVRTEPGTAQRFPRLGERFHPDEAPGFGDTFIYGGLGVGLAWDDRDKRHYPRTGTLISGDVEQFLGFSENASDYRRFSLEAQHFLPLPGHDHRLATLARFDWLDHGNAEMPFFLTRGLGGSHNLRSFPLNRFRGEDIAFMTLEYRSGILPGRLDAVLFWDTGAVSERLGDFSLDSLKHSFGGGIRLMRHDEVLLRFDVARGSEGTRLILSFGGTF